MRTPVHVTNSTRLALVVILAIGAVLGFTVVAGNAGATPVFDKCLEDTGDYDYCLAEYRRTTTTAEATTAAPTTTVPGATTTAPAATTTVPGATTTVPAATTTVPAATTTIPGATTTAPAATTTTILEGGSATSIVLSTVPAVVEGSTSDRETAGSASNPGSSTGASGVPGNQTTASDLAFTGNTASGPVGIGLVVLGVGIVAAGLRRRRTLD